MATATQVADLLHRLDALREARYAIGAGIRFNKPTLLFQTYPRSWVDLYEREGLVLSDPAVHWGLSHTGMVTWAELADKDERGVFAKAAEHGLVHGIAVSLGDPHSRTLAFFARRDAAFDETEKRVAYDTMAELNAAMKDVETLDASEIEKLQRISEGLVDADM